ARGGAEDEVDRLLDLGVAGHQRHRSGGVEPQGEGQAGADEALAPAPRPRLHRVARAHHALTRSAPWTRWPPAWWRGPGTWCTTTASWPRACPRSAPWRCRPRPCPSAWAAPGTGPTRAGPRAAACSAPTSPRR